MSVIQSAFFDLDGTLTDSREGICRCYAYALERLDRESPQLASLEQYIGPPLRVVFPILLGSDNQTLVEQAVANFRERFSTVGLLENVLMPHTPELLYWCKEQNLKVYLVTSKPQVYAERILDHFEIRHLFREVYGSQLDGTHDNKGDLIAHLLSTEEMLPSQAVMIGDRAEDIVAALRNKVPPLGLTCGFGTHEELSAAGAHQIFSNLIELQDWLSLRVCRAEV